MKDLTSTISTPTFAQSYPLLKVNTNPQTIPTTSFLQTTKNMQNQLIGKSIFNNIHAKFLTRKIHKKAKTVRPLPRVLALSQKSMANPKHNGPKQNANADRISEWFQSQTTNGQS